MGNAEIGEAGSPVLCQQDVRRLEIAVQDAQVVGARQGICYSTLSIPPVRDEAGLAAPAALQ